MKQSLAFVPDSESSKVGWLCVKYADTLSTPEWNVLYWPIAKGNVVDMRGMFPELDTDAQLLGRGQDGYRFYRGNGSYSPVLRLKDGGSTQSIKSETIPIPCPKVRKGIETRWYQGGWQKYLKSEGWINA